MTAPTDWREGYLICEHVAAGRLRLTADGWALSINVRTCCERVCCMDCYQIQDEHGRPRFLFEDLDEREEGRFLVGRLRK